MANYSGLHTGTQMYCGVALQPWLTADGTITGITCTSIYANGAVGSLVINGSTVALPDGTQLDLQIDTVTGTKTNACFLCTCFNCADPDSSYTFPNNSIHYNYSGDTWFGGDGGRGMGANSGGIRGAGMGSSDPHSNYTRLGLQGLRN